MPKTNSPTDPLRSTYKTKTESNRAGVWLTRPMVEYRTRDGQLYRVGRDGVIRKAKE